MEQKFSDPKSNNRGRYKYCNCDFSVLTKLHPFSSRPIHKCETPYGGDESPIRKVAPDGVYWRICV